MSRNKQRKSITSKINATPANITKQPDYGHSSGLTTPSSITWRFGFDLAQLLREAGPLWMHSCVAAGLGYLQRNFPRAYPVVERRKGRVGQRGLGRASHWEVVDRDPVLDLLANPNPYMTFPTLGAAIVTSLVTDGNHYIIKVRDRSGVVKELWPVPHTRMSPVWWEGSRWIEGYIMQVDGKYYGFLPEDVIHLRIGFDPLNERYGLSPLLAGLQEIVTDYRVTSYTAGISQRAGLPSAIFSPRDWNSVKEMTEKSRQSWQSEITRTYSGENAGAAMVPPFPVDVQLLSVTPDRMAIEKLRDPPEARICALMGLHALSLGLSVGEKVKSYNNQRETERQSWTNGVMPIQESVADALTHQLVPEFSDPRKRRIWWDWSDVPALREERSELERARLEALRVGAMSLNEFRSVIGLPPVQNGDVVGLNEYELEYTKRGGNFVSRNDYASSGRDQRGTGPEDDEQDE